MSLAAGGQQTKWPDDYASSQSCELTLRTNGEQKTTVIRPDKMVVRAGIEAPTIAPVVLASGGGTLTAGKYYAYAYCLASAQYPGVPNAVTTGNGQLWPRGNPSPTATATPA